MSIVFDARKQAEQSKRAREIPAASPQSPDLPSAVRDAAPSVENSSATSVHRATALGFAVERRTADWRVSWSPDAALGAVRGRLSVSDGLVNKHVDLGAGELQTGSMVYSSTSSDVLFRLEIVGAQSETPICESVRVVAQPWLPPSQNDDAPSLPWSSQTGAARRARSTAARLPDASGIADNAPLVRSLLRLPRAGLNPGASAASKFGQPSGLFEPATPIARGQPVYPASARAGLIAGSVEVHFRISAEGSVYDVRLVKGSPVLGQAAVHAVQSWRYSPARLNGVAVESEASTNFDFKLN